MIDVNEEYEDTDDLNKLDPSFHALFVGLHEIFKAMGQPKTNVIQMRPLHEEDAP